MKETPYLTAEQLAEEMQFSTDWIWRLARRGELPAVKVGRRWRFSRKAVEKWFEKGRARSDGE